METRYPPAIALKPRFSLRVLLIFMTVAVLFCWWRQRPATMADRFIEAVEARQYAEADELFVNPARPFVAEFMKRDDRNRISVTREPQTPGEWLRGVCRVTVALEDFSGLGASIVLRVAANARGMRNFAFHSARGAIKYAPDPTLQMDIQTR